MKRSKKIICKSWDPLAHRPSYPVPWSDTYATFHQGRKKITIYPTLIDGSHLEDDIQNCKDINAQMREIMKNKLKNNERCEMYDTDGNVIDWLSHDPDPSRWEDDSEFSDIPLLTKRKEYFDAFPNEDFLLEEDDVPSLAGIYYYEIITRNELNQNTANKAIEWYLRKKNLVGQVSLRFHWPKPKFIVIPVGI